MIKVWFDEKEIPAFKNIKGEEVPAKTVVIFHLEKPALKGTTSFPTTFDGIATEEHRAQYPDAWAAFLKSKEPVEDKSEPT